MSNTKLAAFFEENGQKATIDHYRMGTREIHYAATGDTSKTHVMFFHGAPGSLTAFNDFLIEPSLTANYRLIAVDRPGYGYSNFGKSVSNLKEQSTLLKPLLELNQADTPTILVGHSLGGPLIARMALDYPDLVDALIMVAPSIDPALEPEEDWFRIPLHTPFLRWILPISFRVTNDEILDLEGQLEEMLPEWKEITCPVIIVQGGVDRLVDPGNAEFGKRMLVSAPTELMIKKDMDHFVPWSNPELIHEAIRSISEKLSGQN